MVEVNTEMPESSNQTINSRIQEIKEAGEVECPTWARRKAWLDTRHALQIIITDED
jgi:hypothetical protein